MSAPNTEKAFKIGQLVIVEKDTFCITETCFNEKFKYHTTILYEDNLLLKKHSIGLIVGFITNWVTPAVVATFSDVKNGQRIVITNNKIELLNDFIKKLDAK